MLASNTPATNAVSLPLIFSSPSESLMPPNVWIHGYNGHQWDITNICF
jgi:hypothetical protein